MKVGELIQRVQSLYSKGVESYDTRLKRRHVYNKLLSVRSKLLFQKLNKKQYVSDWNYQVLPCVKLKSVQAHECPCLPPVGCTILRTVEKLPKPINSISNHVLKAVTSIEGSVIFGETSWKAKKWRAGDKYTSAKPDYFTKDGYLYITVSKAIKVIFIMGLFNDPVEAENFPSYCDSDSDEVPCGTSPMEVEFSIDDDLIDILIEMSVQELVFAFSQMKEDVTNDARDNTGMIQRRYPRQSQNQTKEQDEERER